MQTGLVSHIQRYSLQDGPGIRTTVFLKGCPLQCAWCHNPENISPRPELMLFKERCIHCGACQVTCPRREWNGQDSEARRPPGCAICGACADACPTGARKIVGRPMPATEVVREILADRIFYDDSGGGVTFSGGEPLAQSDFLRTVLTQCRHRGLHTVVDTCGLAPCETLLALVSLVDLFLFDLKLIDEERHRQFCGASNRLILANLAALAETSAQVWIRIPIVPGVNDMAEEVEAMAQFVASLPGHRPVNLLPYHSIGRHKFERLGQPSRLPDLAPPPPEHMNRLAERFRAAGVPTTIAG